jgi:hypothetical protein
LSAILAQGFTQCSDFMLKEEFSGLGPVAEIDALFAAAVMELADGLHPGLHGCQSHTVGRSSSMQYEVALSVCRPCAFTTAISTTCTLTNRMN